jgi:phage baseplate assembly protein gpV
VEVAVEAQPSGSDRPLAEIYLGLVVGVDPAAVKAKVKVPDLLDDKKNPLVSDWLPVPQFWTHGARSFALPRSGQQVYVAFFDRFHNDGFVLGGRYSDKGPPRPALDAEELFIGLGDEDRTHVSMAPARGSRGDEIEIGTAGSVKIHGDRRLQIASSLVFNVFGEDVTITAWKKHRLTAHDLAAKVANNAEADCGAITIKAKQGAKILAGGSVTIKAKNGIELQAEGPITVKAPEVSVEADSVAVKAKAIAVDATASLTVTSPAVTINGALTVTGALAAASVAAGGASMSASGAVTAASVASAGPVTAADFVSAAGKTLLLHAHTSAAPGAPTSPPV